MSSHQEAAPDSSNKYRRWTPDEDQQLVEFCSKDLGWVDIGARLGRDYFSVHGRWIKILKLREEQSWAVEAKEKAKEVKKRQKNEEEAADLATQYGLCRT